MITPPLPIVKIIMDLTSEKGSRMVKLGFLKELDTKSLVNRMHTLEDELFQALQQESEFKFAHAEYLASYSSDCRAVEEIMAGLEPPHLEPPNRSISHHRSVMTVDQRKVWFTRQRKENPELAMAITKQHDVAVMNDQHRIRVEIIHKRLEGVRIVLSLKTAQIRFLTGEDR